MELDTMTIIAAEALVIRKAAARFCENHGIHSHDFERTIAENAGLDRLWRSIRAGALRRLYRATPMGRLPRSQRHG